MGKPKEKVKESTLIMASELFTNQCCPYCGTFCAIEYMTAVRDKVLLTIACLGDDCDYVGVRELV